MEKFKNPSYSILLLASMPEILSKADCTGMTKYRKGPQRTTKDPQKTHKGPQRSITG